MGVSNLSGCYFIAAGAAVQEIRGQAHSQVGNVHFVGVGLVGDALQVFHEVA